MAKKSDKKSHGGKREGAGRKAGSANKTATDLMKEMGCPPEWMPPLVFCLAVMNNDNKFIGNKVAGGQGRPRKDGGAKPITISQRIEASRIAIPYLNQKLPEVLDLGVADSWAQMVRDAEERERKMKKQYDASA